MTDRLAVFDRTARLTGIHALYALGEAKVIIFGVGGVGSWAAETLVRTGLGHLTVVDADCVALSNINRQLPALASTVGQPKVDVLRTRLLEINPEADITAIQGLYDAASAPEFHLEDYDFVIDCIDSLADKALLILNATRAAAESARSGRQLGFFSSMGAALKMDPSRIAVAEFWKVKGCPLAAALRRRFKKSGTFPHRKFKCVYSDELVANSPDFNTAVDEAASDSMTFNKVVVNGSLMHITSIFGITLASLVIRAILDDCRK